MKVQTTTEITIDMKEIIQNGFYNMSDLVIEATTCQDECLLSMVDEIENGVMEIVNNLVQGNLSGAVRSLCEHLQAGCISVMIMPSELMEMIDNEKIDDDCPIQITYNNNKIGTLKVADIVY